MVECHTYTFGLSSFYSIAALQSHNNTDCLDENLISITSSDTWNQTLLLLLTTESLGERNPSYPLPYSNSAAFLHERTKYLIRAKHKDSPVHYHIHQTTNHPVVV